MSKTVKVKDIKIGRSHPLVLIAGPCQIQDLDHTLFLAEKILKTCSDSDIKFIFKSSFDKANRSSHHSSRGVGIEKGLQILEKVKECFGCPVLTDIHEISQIELVAEVVDVIQIPAFLSRQTDLNKKGA